LILIWNVILTLSLPLTLIALALWAFISGHNFFHRLGFFPRMNDGRIWIHASSVGEAGVAASIRDILKKIDPDENVIMTATTQMGMERLKRLAKPGDFVSVFPADYYFFMKNAFRRSNPRALIIIETELWPNLILSAYRRDLPIILANGRISNSTLKWGKLFNRTFSRITRPFKAFLMKSEYDAENLKDIGVNDNRISVLGNLKFASKADIETISIERKPIFIAGCVRKGEFEPVLIAYLKIRKKIENLFLIIAPRHLEDVKIIKRLIEKHGIKANLRSEQKPFEDSDVLVLDTMGELLKFYGAADVAFIGGTLQDYGGHNPLEPAHFGVPILFGPYQESNQEAFDVLLRIGGGIQVKNSDELARKTIALFQNNDKLIVVGNKAKKAVDEMQEVTGLYEKKLKEYLTR